MSWVNKSDVFVSVVDESLRFLFFIIIFYINYFLLCGFNVTKSYINSVNTVLFLFVQSYLNWVLP